MTTPSLARSPRSAPVAPSAAHGPIPPALAAFARSGVPGRLISAFLASVAMVGVIELLGRPPGVEPAILLPLVVTAAAFVAGLPGAALAGVPGVAYAVLYYGLPAWSAVDGNGTRVLGAVIVSALGAWLVAHLRDRIARVNAEAAGQREHGRAVIEFAAALAGEPVESLPNAVVSGTGRLLDVDMCVLTVLDPPSGRHVVRAVHGTASSALGIEIVPGVGITGQAIRERQIVTAGGQAVARGGPVRQSMVAVPVLQTGRVVATLTLGHSDGRAFDAGARWAIDQIVPIIGLAVIGMLARSEVEDGSPHDPTTGLANRAYLDATLDQLVALRRRTPPDERGPLSMVLFDIDSFHMLNERHGRPMGDQVLRAVATLLRQRFRASDIMARVGPDSFVVVLDGANSETAAEAAAQIRRQVRELSLTSPHGEPVVISVSGGCAMFRDGEPPDSLIRSVEAALETARWSGPGAVVSI